MRTFVVCYCQSKDARDTSEFLAREQRISAGFDLAQESHAAFVRGDQATFQLFSQAAACLIGPGTEGSERLFQLAGHADLETVPAAHRETISSCYDKAFETVDKAIQDFKLPEHYRLPALELFSERLKAVLPGFATCPRQKQRHGCNTAETWAPAL